MPTSFLSLPGEIRNVIYEKVLVQQHTAYTAPLCRTLGVRRQLAPGILSASKAISREAASVLYARTSFDLSPNTPDEIVAFLERIGPANASFIVSVCIRPPWCKLQTTGPQCRVTLADPSARLLAKLQSACTSLSTLTMTMSSSYRLEFGVPYGDVTEALDLVDAGFRAIESLTEIVLEIEDRHTDDRWHVKGKYGWTLRVTESTWQPRLRSHRPCCLHRAL